MEVTCNDFSSNDVSILRMRDMLYYQARVAALLRAALAEGVVITVTNPPALPLAMGNYNLEVDVRALRNFEEGK